MNRYSLSSDSGRWWMPAGAAGLSAATVIAVALLATPSGSAPERPSLPTDIQQGYAHIPGSDVQRGYAHIPERSCPPPPDRNYVGVPWVAHSHRCPSLAEWWLHGR